MKIVQVYLNVRKDLGRIFLHTGSGASGASLFMRVKGLTKRF